MLHLGITGGIGSGKSTVCKIFESLGIPIYYADDRAKVLMVEDEAIRRGLITLFGEEAYLPTGQLNRPHIANMAFNNKTLLTQLNNLVHPVVAADGLAWQASQQQVPYTLKEAALLIESGSFKSLDRVIVVTAPQEIRIDRVIKRDQTSREAVKSRIDKQLSEPEMLTHADFHIINDSKSLLIPQVIKIHQTLLTQLAQQAPLKKRNI